MQAVSLFDKVTAERWERIQAFSLDLPGAPLPFSKCLAHEMDWSPEFADLAISEYRKFTLLCTLFPNETVPSTHVDTVWHMHLLYTRNYHRYCREALGQEFLHHEPASGDDAEAALFKQMYSTTLHRYKELFALIPPIAVWGE